MANNDEHGFGSMNEDKQRDIASAIANVTPAPGRTASQDGRTGYLEELIGTTEGETRFDCASDWVAGRHSGRG